MEIILGSQSPRRAEILGYFSLPFTQVTSHFDEESVPYEGDPFTYTRVLSLEKAKVIQKQFPNSIILTADTVVSVDNMVLGKPKDDEEMKQVLQLLSGRAHSVITGVCVASPEVYACGCEETKVFCNRVTPDEIHRYMRSHNLKDKAGSYAIQRSGSLFVNKIEGCYHNVCGLPINTLREMLGKVGIDLWDYLKEF